MRILSIAVRNYRLHRELKIDLDPLRTVISGPNESGKSTVVEAVHRALFLRSKTTGDFQKAMIPRLHGGHPEVEVAFEAGGVAYRVIKRFSGANGTTTLTDKSGPSWSGDEAEQRLAALLGVESTGGKRQVGDRVVQQWAHLWVRQGTAGQDPTAHATAQHDSLLARLQGSGGAAAMQSALDVQVAAKFRSLEELTYTQTGTFRTNSPAAIAIAEYGLAQSELEESKRTMAKLVDAAAGLEEANKTITRSDESLALMRPQLTAVETKLGRVTILKAEERTQDLVVTTTTEKHEALVAAEMGITRLRQELSQAKESLAPKEQETARLLATEEGLRVESSKAEEARQKATTDVRVARLRFDLGESYLRQLEKSLQRDQIALNVEKLRVLRAELAALEEKAAQTPAITADNVKKLQRLEGDCSKAESALNAMATGVEIIQAEDSVYLDGTSIEVGQSRILTEDADLKIGSDTLLRIRPGGGTSLAQARRDLETKQATLQNELDHHGLKTVNDAVDASAKHQQLATEIKSAKKLLENLGAETIDDEYAQAQQACSTAEAEVKRRRQLVVHDLEPSDDRTKAGTLVAQLQDSLTQTEQIEATALTESETTLRDVQKVTQQIADHRKSLLEANRVISDLEAQLRLLLETHGEDSVRETKHAELLGLRTEAKVAHDQILGSLEELQPTLLEADQGRLSRAIEQLAATKAVAEQNRAVHRNELQRDGSGDPQADLALAEARMQSTKEKKERVERKSAATHLLHELFREEQKSQSEELARPFSQKIGGYLECLFGAGASASVTLENNAFSELHLIRPLDQAGAFNFETLSGGTCEQLAAAVRLAMAEVLAEGHHGCLPIVFDDAFVNSDPERVQMLQRMLDRAATAGLQVIVLTCNPSDYAAFGAQPFSMPLIARG